MVNKRSKSTHLTRGGDESGGHWIWRPYRVDPRTGKTLWAKHYGFKAWRIWVPDDTPEAEKPDQSS